MCCSMRRRPSMKCGGRNSFATADRLPLRREESDQPIGCAKGRYQ
jgi:hypothetical protein